MRVIKLDLCGKILINVCLESDVVFGSNTWWGLGRSSTPMPLPTAPQKVWVRYSTTLLRHRVVVPKQRTLCQNHEKVLFGFQKSTTYNIISRLLIGKPNAITLYTIRKTSKFQLQKCHQPLAPSVSQWWPHASTPPQGVPSRATPGAHAARQIGAVSPSVCHKKVLDPDPETL